MAFENDTVKKKLTFVGDDCCGKTSLLRTALLGHFPDTAVPFESGPGTYQCLVTTASGKETVVDLVLWDTAGAFEYGRLDPLKWMKVDVFIICFAIDSIPSLDGVEDTWLPKINHVNPVIPIILVGLRKDRRDQRQDSGKAGFVTSSMGEKVRSTIGAYKTLLALPSRRGILDGNSS
uniref:GTP-binding protein rhoA n=1 Tax=Fusarium oxysporum (strain Fo5176) TaxID=660025 RepID=A0A0D2YI08_FUSOF